jgi:CDGSH-type Zn-finger protein
VAFDVAGDRPLKLCLCKHTRKPPYCDGSHNSL